MVDRSTTIQVVLSKELYAAVKLLCKKKEVSVSSWFRDLAKSELQKEADKPSFDFRQILPKTKLALPKKS